MVIEPTPGEHLRPSYGLEQLFAVLDPTGQRQVLDLGEFTQANVTKIIGLGHRLTFEDILGMVDNVFGPGDPNVVQADVGLTNQFLSSILDFEPETFDAIFVWKRSSMWRGTWWIRSWRGCIVCCGRAG